MLSGSLTYNLLGIVSKKLNLIIRLISLLTALSPAHFKMSGQSLLLLTGTFWKVAGFITHSTHWVSHVCDIDLSFCALNAPPAITLFPSNEIIGIRYGQLLVLSLCVLKWIKFVLNWRKIPQVIIYLELIP